MNEENLSLLEVHIQQNYSLVEKLEIDCIHGAIYKLPPDQSNEFKLLPGHKALLISWVSSDEFNEHRSSDTFNINSTALPPILREIISNALLNEEREARRYSELLMNFCIYLYIMAGKASYEILSQNLNLPKPGTISEYHYFFLIDLFTSNFV